jgi:two-component sensor kinase yesM
MNRKKTILFEMTISFILVIFFTSTILGIYTFNNLGKYINSQIKFYQEQNIKQVYEKLDSYTESIDSVERILTGIAIEHELFQKGTGSRNSINNEIYLQSIDDMLRVIRRTSTCINNIFMVCDKGNYTSSNYFDSDMLIEKSWYKEALIEEKNTVTTIPHNADYQSIYGDGPVVISVVKKVISPRDAKTIIGVIMLDIDYSTLVNELKSSEFDDKNLILLRNEDNGMIANSYSLDFSKAEEYRGKMELTKKSISTYKYETKKYGWKVEVIVSKASLYSKFGSVLNTFVLIVIITVVFSIVLSYILAKKITKPINQLVLRMQDLSKGDFNARVDEVENRDIQVLSDGFNKMSYHIKQLMDNLRKKDYESANARFLALQAQINPHFLYNTLETIRSIAIRNQVESIADMAKSMADIFRYSVDSTKEEVILKDELKHVKNYINIQKIRYKERLNVEFNIDESLLNYKIIKLVIQPLVENAIYHGIDMKKEAGKLCIECSKFEDKVLISVSDNGIGIKKQDLEELRKNLENSIDRKINKSIGLINVNSRLKLYYGENCSLSIESDYDIGTKVYFKIPITLQ